MQKNEESGNYNKIIVGFLIVGVLLFIFFDSDFGKAFRRGFISVMTENKIITFSECKDLMRKWFERDKDFQKACKEIVERKHGTVTVKEVYLLDIHIITADGKYEVVLDKKIKLLKTLKGLC